MRSSDRERDRTAARLRRACVAGEIGVDTFESRLGLTFAARTQAELRPLTRDLRSRWDRARELLALPPRSTERSLPQLRVDPEATALVIGRSRRSDLVFEQDSISRRHARLARGVDGWHVVDLNSTNGTRVNGRRFSGRHPLEPGDVLTLGELMLEFRPREAGDS